MLSFSVGTVTLAPSAASHGLTGTTISDPGRQYRTADVAQYESPATNRHLDRRFRPASLAFQADALTIADARRDLHIQRFRDFLFDHAKGVINRQVIADGTLMLSKRFFENTATSISISWPRVAGR